MSGAIPGLSRMQLSETLVLHPRVLQQDVLTPAARSRLLATLPELVPFVGSYAGALLVADWDHHLPSRQLALRIFAYRSAPALAAGRAALGLRAAEIAAKNRYPEFDLPDFAALRADEAYEADLATTGEVARPRLVSEWRRNVDPLLADEAIAVVRESKEFAALGVISRSAHLGDLEAVGWVPPCESGFPGWTIDVWYLLSFEGRVGSGRSLLVAQRAGAEPAHVAAVRDFSVRA